MIRATVSSKNKRNRDKGRIILQIGKHKIFHISDKEASQLLEDLINISTERGF